jgi:peptidoglycan/LPS O-acetylase OafA/YrhL
MQWLGERSYAIYVVHVAVIVEFKRIYLADGRGPWTALALATLIAGGVSLVLAEVLHRTVERPFLALRGRLAVMPRNRLAPQAEQEA